MVHRRWVAGGLVVSGVAAAALGQAADPSAQSGGTGSAELRPMDTDRPNKTNSPHTIDAGHVQIEFGAFDWTYSQSRGAKPWESAATFAQTNVRVGVSDRIELNVIVNPLVATDSGPDAGGERARASGFGDTTVGGKFNLWGNESGDDVWATAMGVQPQVKIPTAPDELGNGHVEVYVGVPFLVNMPEDFHLAVQPTASWERNASDTHDQAGWQFAVSLDRVVFETVDVYAEYWIHLGQDQKPQESIDVGLSWLLTERCALDTGVNFGLNDATPDIEWTAGVSFKF